MYSEAGLFAWFPPKNLSLNRHKITAAGKMLRQHIVDNNIVISSILRPHSLPYTAIGKAFEEGEVLMSEEIAHELRSTILRPKFERYRPLELRVQLSETFLRQTRIIPITQTTTLCRDPSDNKFLDLALSGNADILLTGDTDLLSLHPFQNTDILSPADFLSL